jgi:hypothetical protein
MWYYIALGLIPVAGLICGIVDWAKSKDKTNGKSIDGLLFLSIIFPIMLFGELTRPHRRRRGGVMCGPGGVNRSGR